MSTRNPRIHTVLDRPLFDAVERLAKRDGFSLSEEVADLIRDAIALREDRALDRFAHERRKSWSARKALSLEQLRRRLRAR